MIVSPSGPSIEHTQHTWAMRSVVPDAPRVKRILTVASTSLPLLPVSVAVASADSTTDRPIASYDDSISGRETNVVHSVPRCAPFLRLTVPCGLTQNRTTE